MEILNSTYKDLPAIFSFYHAAVEYQRAKGYNLWPEFKRPMIEREIGEKRNWKIVENDNIACVFSVQYSDPVIWGEEKNNDSAVYLHRIAVNPVCKGRHMMALVRDWAIGHGRSLGKKYVRMDTWGNNSNLRKYYLQSGFTYLGQRYLDEPPWAPAHYGGPVLSLFEITL